MDSKRRGEIALLLLKYLIGKRGIPPSQHNAREFRNAARSIGVSHEELDKFIKLVVQELLDEYFSAQRLSENHGRASGSQKR